MATPPFQVEDQTDEDFFDKLVDDDFGIAESSKVLMEGVESDEAKAFANLSLGDEHTVVEDSGNRGFDSESVILPSMEAQEKDILVEEESISLVSDNSLAFDPSNDAMNTTDLASDSTTSNSSGSSGGTNVKEVQWSAFNADSARHDERGFGSYSDFFTELEDRSLDQFPKAESNPNHASIVRNQVADLATSFNSSENQDSHASGAFGEKTTDGQDLNSSQYWENLYPGWKYDQNSGQWYQLDGFGVTENTQEAFQDKAQSSGEDVISSQRSEISYLQQTTQSLVGTVADNCTTGSVSNWNQASQGSTEYPSNMVFDPQYPGWYYDTIAQEWRSLESYTQTTQTGSTALDKQTQNENSYSAGFFSDKDHSLYSEFSQHNLQGQGGGWTGSADNYTPQNMWEPEPVTQSGVVAAFTGNQQMGNMYASSEHVNSYIDQQGFKAMDNVSLYGNANHNYHNKNAGTGFQSFASTANLYQFNPTQVEQSQQTHFSHDYHSNQKPINYSQQPFQTGNASYNQFSYASTEGRSSAGHPPHALVTFGFGGKLVVMKDNSSFGTSSAYGSQDPVGRSVSILNLMEVVTDKTDAANNGCGAFSYFHALCQQAFSGPLVGGNVATKELNKWIDERIASCGSTNMDFRKAEQLRLLFSLLKISYEHYGKLRSPFAVNPTLQETKSPESDVVKLFASARRNGAQLSEYGTFSHCMKNLPSEGQIRATAVEVQNLLVSGRRKEALQCAQEGQLWSPALLLATQLGEKFYVDTVKQMAHCQFVSGSPLRTLCLLIAGQHEDVFSADSSVDVINTSQQPTQDCPNGMLDDWQENLAIITANRTKDDELVIINLGDCLYKHRGEITAAHTCYLVAEANFESYSNSARLCLVGADHWKYPRTYASPDAIQRTEFYEYSKAIGNSQFILLPFLPYKIIYAHMLAEVGKVSDSLRYCQATLRALKSSGHDPQVESWKSLLSSLEERIRTHQQGGYSTNLAPAKLVGKLFTSIDRSIHRMMGAPPLPTPSTSQSNFPSNDHDNFSMPAKVANSQSTMAMSSLMPSASMEPISDWTVDGNRMAMHSRSISEPDFARTPKQMDASKEGDARGKASMAGGPSRFGRIGSQLLQKTMGWVSRSRTDHQAKLGETNKFYYDERLKRWVEEGAEPPAEEPALPPPPTAASLQNGSLDYNMNSAFKSQNLPANGGPQTQSPNPLEHSSGIPPIPPTTNQFSARGRMGLRSRYVDTFNKGGGTPTNLFQSPSVPAPKPMGAAKFFVPTPAASFEQTLDSTESIQEETANEDPSTSMQKDSPFSSDPSSSSPMQRFPSMNNITPVGNKGMAGLQNGNGALSARSRAASWSGNYTDLFNNKTTEVKPSGEVLGMPQATFMPIVPSLMRPNNTSLPMNSGSFGDDLHEVEL
ncbi:protein transport protein SEC16A homolog [Tasmannia lanceolata]|uniref:protein transport protein SEC16A homolog n=1 Tax=Tasmannia lanceolata TaxID=3420 RepID=UPI004063A1B2